MKSEAHMLTSNPQTRRQTAPTVTFRAPSGDDGAAVQELIRACGPLDTNSLYSTLLLCDHFADTCVLAEVDGVLSGWVSGYIVPGAPDTLFVWQVAVHASARGMGLGGRMLDALVARDACDGVENVNTTITADNDASWALFSSFARRHAAPLERSPHFKRDEHFGGRHATEIMAEIGPFGALRVRKAA
jgi:L-2,4-diaminobutyric acid acetyltransferase